MIYEGMKVYLEHVIIQPFRGFEADLAAKDEKLRIKKALAKKPADRMGSQVTERVQGERRAEGSTVEDIINKTVNKKVAALQKETEYLKSLIAGKAGGKKDFRGAGKAAGRSNANNKNRAGAAGGGSASSAAKGKKKDGNNGGKRGGKRRSSKGGKRN